MGLCWKGPLPAQQRSQQRNHVWTDHIATSTRAHLLLLLLPSLHCTQWYAWPEGYLGQSFNLAGKMEPRATALRDDIDKLAQFCQFRREESQFSEHTITSAEDAAMMVSAVVGADVDMGLLKAGGSANFEMYQVGGWGGL